MTPNTIWKQSLNIPREKQRNGDEIFKKNRGVGKEGSFKNEVFRNQFKIEPITKKVVFEPQWMCAYIG